MARNKIGRGLSYLRMMVLGAALGALGTGCMMAPKPFGVTETTTLRVDADGLVLERLPAPDPGPESRREVALLQEVGRQLAQRAGQHVDPILEGVGRGEHDPGGRAHATHAAGGGGLTLPFSETADGPDHQPGLTRQLDQGPVDLGALHDDASAASARQRA